MQIRDAIAERFARGSRALERVLLPEGSAFDLAVLRLLLGGYFTWFLADRRGEHISVAVTSDPEVFAPLGIAAGLAEPLSASIYVPLYTACQVLAVPFVLGLWFRVAGPLFALLFLFLLTYRQCFGFVYHTENITALHALVLGFAPSAHVLSLDAWLPELRARSALPRGVRLLSFLSGPPFSAVPPVPLERSYRYGFPIALILLVMGIAYWVAGMAKIGIQGVTLHWVTEGSLYQQIGNNALRYELLAGGAKPITETVLSWPIWVISALSGGSLLLELSGPLLVLPGLVRYLLALGFFSFHWGIWLTMGIPFPYQLYGWAFLPVVPWERAFTWARGRLARTPLAAHEP